MPKKLVIISVEKNSDNPSKRQIKLTMPIVYFSISLFFLLTILLSFCVFYFTLHNNSESVLTRKKLEKQHIKLLALSKQLREQENYMESIQVFFGNKIQDTMSEPFLPKSPTINYEQLSDELTENEKQLFNGKNLEGSTTKKGSNKPALLNQKMYVPMLGYVSQKYKYNRHEGIDLVAEKGSKTVACMSGKVVFCGFSKKDGRVVVLSHPGGWISVYKHNKYISVQSGMDIVGGQTIGVIGNSGENSSGPHLHFELWHQGLPINPEQYIQFKN